MTDVTPTMSSPARFWDRLAPRYAKQPVPDEAAYMETLERTRNHLRASDHVLELGCGTGSTALRLGPSVASYRATDFSAGMIAIAREKTPVDDVSFAQAGLDDVDIEDTGKLRTAQRRADRKAPYDAVIAFNLLHLIEDLDTALAQIHALVRPGGVFISKTVTTPTGPLPWKLRLILLALPLLQAFGRAPKVAFRSRADHQGAIERAGFDVIERGDYPASPPNRFIVARRRD